METEKFRIPKLPTLILNLPFPGIPGRDQTALMISRTHINRFIIFAFMVLVGYALAYGIKVQSVTGIILALVSLSAGVYFLYLLAKAKQDLQSQQEQEERA